MTTTVSSAPALLDALRTDHGLEVALEGEDLRVTPVEALTANVRSLILEHKAQLVECLRPTAAGLCDRAEVTVEHLGGASTDDVAGSLARLAAAVLEVGADDQLREAVRAEAVRRLRSMKVVDAPARLVDAHLSADADADAGERKPSQAAWLVTYVEDAGSELWHTPGCDAYATLPVADHREHVPVRSRGMRDWLRRAYRAEHGHPPSAQAVQDAVDQLGATARIDGAEHPAYVRVAHHDGRIYLDLGGAEWQAVEIDASGWRLMSDPPVRFRRPSGLLSLHAPEAGGNLEDLGKLVNLEGDAWVLAVAWLIGALSPGPYAILVLRGEQGTAKTTTARMLAGLVDPRTPALRGPPREERDLVIGAQAGYILVLDNLSRIPDWLSDGLCRLATGGGWATRALYTDDEEVIVDATRPMCLTGIDDVLTRDDLADRAVVVDLEPIPDAKRRQEAHLWAAYEQARPRLLGALLDAASTALRRQADIELPGLPRMADWARWVAAAEPALPWSEGDFLRAYTGAREDMSTSALESDPVAAAVLELVQGDGCDGCDGCKWSGSAGELLEELGRRVGEAMARSRRWPQSPRGLSGALRRAAPALRRAGVEVKTGERESGTGRRLVQLTYTPRDGEQNGYAPDRHNRHTSSPSEEKCDGCDANGPGCDGRVTVESDGPTSGGDGCDGQIPTHSGRQADGDTWRERL